MNEFDDPQVASMLGRLSGSFPDVNVAQQAVNGRVRQVKRRRAIMASTAAGFVLLGGAAVVAQGVGPRGQVTPADRGSSSQEASSTTAAESTTEVENTATSTTEAGATTVLPTVTVTVPAGQGGTPGTTGTSNTSGSHSGSSSSSSTPRTTVTVVKDTDTTVASDGGSIVYHWDGSTLTLVDVAEAAGWTPHVTDQSATRLRVEFTNGPDTWRVEVRTDGSGKQPVEITQHG